MAENEPKRPGIVIIDDDEANIDSFFPGENRTGPFEDIKRAIFQIHIHSTSIDQSVATSLSFAQKYNTDFFATDKPPSDTIRNKYANLLNKLNSDTAIKNRAVDRDWEVSRSLCDDVLGGHETSNIEYLKTLTQQRAAEFKMFVVFDFDWTLSVLPGLPYAPSELPVMYMSAIKDTAFDKNDEESMKKLNESMKHDYIEYLMGGPTRMQMMTKLYEWLKTNGADVVILSNNQRFSKYNWVQSSGGYRATLTKDKTLMREDFLAMIQIMFPGFEDKDLIFTRDEFVKPNEKIHLLPNELAGGKGLAFRRWLDRLYPDSSNYILRVKHDLTHPIEPSDAILAAPATNTTLAATPSLGGKRKIPRPIRLSKPRKTSRRKTRKSKSRRARR